MALLLQCRHRAVVVVQAAEHWEPQESCRCRPCANSRKEVQQPRLARQRRKGPAVDGAVLSVVPKGDSLFGSGFPTQASP